MLQNILFGRMGMQKIVKRRKRQNGIKKSLTFLCKTLFHFRCILLNKLDNFI